MRGTGALLTCIGLAAGAAGAAPALTDMQVGVLCTPRIDDYVPAPETTAGFTNVSSENLNIRWAQTIVPASLGISFGLRARAMDQPLAARVRVTHPGFAGSDRDQEIWDANLYPDSESAVFFSFVFDYEVVPGDWRLDLIDQTSGAVIFSQDFTVVPATELPHIVHECAGDDMIS